VSVRVCVCVCVCVYARMSGTVDRGNVEERALLVVDHRSQVDLDLRSGKGINGSNNRP